MSTSGEVCRHSKRKRPETYAADASEPMGFGSNRQQRTHRPVSGSWRTGQSTDKRNVFRITFFVFIYVYLLLFKSMDE